MTLQEAKDQVAVIRGFKNWDDYKSRSYKPHAYIYAMEEVSELYSKSQNSELLDKVRRMEEENLRLTAIITERISNVKPEQTEEPSNP